MNYQRNHEKSALLDKHNFFTTFDLSRAWLWHFYCDVTLLCIIATTYAG